MNGINEYLKLPKSHRLYSVGLSLFQSYRQLYPKQYEKLLSGPFGNNPESLQELLTSISEKNIQITPAYAPPIPVAQIEVVTLEKQTHRDALIRQVAIELRAAYKTRNQLSDRFYELATNEQRAMNSDKVVAQTNLIKSILKKLEYTKIHGRLPEIVEVESFTLPDNAAELSLLQNRKQSHRLKIEKQIELLLTYPEKDSKRKKLPAKQELLDELNVQIEQIKKKRVWLKEQKKQ